MLGALAKYIFGGIMGDVPETTAPELQYHTREVNDWLLVDMPDQAIDNEDMGSESDDDEILTALPLLMAEEVVQPLQIVQSCEEMKDYSACDNSYDKVQRHKVDKIRSVPSVVQHHSGDKTQGNFVDNIEAVSVEVEDNLSDKILDISVGIQDNSDNIIRDKSAAQVLNASVEVQRNSADVVQEVFDYGNQFVLPEVQNISDDEVDSAAEIRAVSVTDNSPEITRDIIFESIQDELKELSNQDLLTTNFDEINSAHSEDKDYSDNEVENHLEVDKVNEEDEYSAEYLIEEALFDSILELGDESLKKKSDLIQPNFIHTNLISKEGFYFANCNRLPANYGCVQRRLYSEVVQGLQNQAATDPMKDILSDQLVRNYDQCVRIFGDKVQESSDDEMNETSDDEMNENYNDEMNENSDIEDESSNDATREKSYNTVAQLSSDEESEESSEDESSDTFVDFHKRFHFVPCKNKELIDERKQIIKEKVFKMLDMVLNHGTGCIPHTEYEHVVGFRNIPQCWYAYQTMQEPLLHALLVRNYYLYEPTGRCPHFKAFLCKNVINKKFKRRSLPVEEKPATIDPSLITNSAEILQNLINQKSTVLPPKTGVVLEHIKDLKPVQEAIQFENRKYLTRSQLNRQNRNYMYQSSTKANRRRNLQRNHSGANNNRKC